MMFVLLEGILDEELNEEFGYSKNTNNNRNWHFSQIMHISYGDMVIAILRDRNG